VSNAGYPKNLRKCRVTTGPLRFEPFEGHAAYWGEFIMRRRDGSRIYGVPDGIVWIGKATREKGLKAA
jgi:hypothetical protein